MVNYTLIAAAVSTTMRIGGRSVDLTSANSIQTLISEAMSSIHYFALGISLCILLYAVTRNYVQFGDHGGVRFVAALLVTIVMIFAFPKICDSIQKATEDYSQGTAETIENMTCFLTEQKVNAGNNGANEKMSIAQKIAHLPESIMHSIQAAMCNIFYVNGIWLGKSIRDIVYFIFKCLYNGALCLTPIFFGALLIPETRQLGVNFITSCFGLTLMPLCFLFGDLCNIWLVDHMWSSLGLGNGGTFWTVARSGAAFVNPVGTVLSYIAFGIIYALLAAVVYIVLPFLYMKLFRSGSPGSPAGFIASAIGKAIHTAIIGGAVLASGGTAAAAGGGGAAGGAASGSQGKSPAQGATQAAKNFSDSAVEDTGKEIDKNMNG